MPTPALGLIRVSTPRQLKSGYSPEEQQAAIGLFADRNGLRIVEYVVEQKTGFTTDRKDVRRMRELAGQGRIRAVVAFVMDRLSRGLEVQLALRREIRDLGLQLYTTTRGLIEDTPEANLLSNVEGAFSQHEIETFVRRSKMGRIGKAKSGRWVGAGQAPYGYRKVGLKNEARLEPVPAQAAIVRRIFEERTRQRAGLRAIAEGLNRDQIVGPGGSLWWVSTVKRILSNRAYIGEFEYSGVRVDLPQLAVVDTAQFAQAAVIAGRNKELSRRNRKHDYDLAGRVQCACGRKMFGESGDRYVCSSENVPLAERACHFGQVYKSNLEPVVLGHVRELLTPDRLNAALRVVEDKRRRAGQPGSRLAAVNKEIDRLKRRMSAIMDEFGDDPTLSGVAADKLRSLALDVQGLEIERDDLKAGAQSESLAGAARQEVISHADQLRAMLDQPDAAIRARVLEALGTRVELKQMSGGRRGVVVETIFGRSKILPIRHNPGR